MRSIFSFWGDEREHIDHSILSFDDVLCFDDFDDVWNQHQKMLGKSCKVLYTLIKFYQAIKFRLIN